MGPGLHCGGVHSPWLVRAVLAVAIGACLLVESAPAAGARGTTARASRPRVSATERTLAAYRHHGTLTARPRYRWRFRAAAPRSLGHAHRARAAVVGGIETSVSQVPWQVVIFAEFEEGGEKFALLCGGSIIDMSHVVTAGHCAYNPATGFPLPASSFVVAASVSNLTEEELKNSEARLVTTSRVHPYFNYAAGAGAPDDVAVLVLKSALTESTKVKPISLPASTSAPPENASLTVSGFGVENPQTGALGKLNSLGMTMTFPGACGGEADALFVCASTPTGTACSGDSGGPVTYGPAHTLAANVDFIQVREHRCFAGALNGFVNDAAPEVRAFIEGSEAPPLAPRGSPNAAISGTPVAGSTLTCESASWSNTPTLSYAFISTANAQLLQEGASASYSLSKADVGRTISCRVKASNSGGVGLSRSSATARVKATTGVPTVTSVSPSSGVMAGGTAVTIKGTGFEREEATVTIGGSVASGVEVISETELTAKTPAHASGTYKVLVANSNGSSTTGPAFEYLPPPSVSSVSPASGPSTGGTALTIKGTGFEAGATKVIVGGQASGVVVHSEGELSATTPAYASGSYEVVVSDRRGTSSAGPRFAYVLPQPPGGESGGGSPEGGQSGAPSGTPSGGVLASSTSNVGAAELESLLAQKLTPGGKAAKIGALLKAGFYTLTFKAPEAGTLVISWYEVPHGAKLASAKPVLVASGRVTFTAAGAMKIKLKLTSAGKRLLRHARGLKLTAKGTFTPVGEAPTATAKGIVLKR